ncbi:proline-rich receptor-like protein kinase PERK3 [Hevea brasiliensis]|uniref:proline-rich receptor-like protein kinase PERK3 n=1 Tax=Hevea brasiliensis TaxID=3981 RepID=UPI0025D48DBF|nr:proline-rich receptor-like protein kinase PERK3 [Hevea brasiliensis]
MASCFWCFNEERADTTGPEPNPLGFRKYTYDELSQATQHFSNATCLGSGAFGEVFKGTIDGQVVAVKKIKYKMEEQQQNKVEEIEYLKRVSHPNVVKLIGYCDEGADKLLVLEFVPNRTLRYHLNDEKNILEWSKRMKIAKYTAYGLHYLHVNCEPKIIHRDIKTDNILLNKKFEPKVADFSLAKFLPGADNVSHITSVLRGTNVYADPEYGNIQKVSKKSDVYSFGVVLLELITGKKPLFGENEDDNIVHWAKSRIAEALNNKKYTDFVDSRLQGAYDKRELHKMISCAAACVYQPSASRPNMRKVIETLEEYEYRDIIKCVWSTSVLTLKTPIPPS